VILKHVVDEASGGRTVKHIMKNHMELSERLVKKLKYSNKILCNSVPVHTNAIVQPGDVVEAVIEFVEDCPGIIPESISLDIIFEDECLIAVNKPPHMVVHPTCSHPSGTLANGVVHYLINKGESIKIRPVSRLDRDTSGVIIFAKNQFVQENLVKQMGRSFVKEYIGIVHGRVENDEGTIDLPIERKPGSIMLRHVSPTGSASVTHYKVLERFDNATLLSFRLETGRTHQIRVHCQAIGHPLMGDTLYTFPDDKGMPVFPEKPLIGRQALHSHKASFIHPVNKNTVVLTAPIPDDISKVLEILKK